MRSFFSPIPMKHSGRDSRKFFEYTAEIERVLISHQPGHFGHGQAFGEKQLFGTLHAQASEKTNGGDADGVLKTVRKMVNAQMAEICHGADIPVVHIMSVQLCNETVYGGIVGLRAVLDMHKTVEQCQKPVKIRSGDILKSELMKLQFQDDFFEYLFQGRMDSDMRIPNLKGGKKGGNVTSRKMNPVDFRILLRQIGVDLRLMGGIENEAAGRHFFPHAASQKMSAALAEIEQLVIGAAVRTADREVFAEMILMAAADYKEGKQGIFREQVISCTVGTGGDTDHSLPP